MYYIVDCFNDIEDPRSGNATKHNIIEILVISLCTILSGGETAIDMHDYGVYKEEFLRSFLELEHGIPSHDTFSRVFRLINPDKLRLCFLEFMKQFNKINKGVIALDGKVLRRSFDKTKEKSALNMISAWSAENRLVLAQVATDEKSNEITAIPKLLELLDIKDCTITVDALNCQRNIATDILEKGGNYAFALKGNQGTLFDDVKLFLDDPMTKLSVSKPEINGDHGRIETRIASLTSEIKWLQDIHNWPGLKAIGKIKRTREIETKISHETAYYLLSDDITPEKFNNIVRSHWGVENQLHWCLDVIMNEDNMRNRKDNSPQNLAIIRHMALNIMRKDQETSKISLRRKFKKAGWDNAFLTRLLSQI